MNCKNGSDDEIEQGSDGDKIAGSDQQQLQIQYLVRKQTIAHTRVRMAHLIQQNQYLPRLAKNKQLDNPYQSITTSATSDISRIFLLNDRRKVTLSEQSDSQQHSPPHTLSQTLNRYLTAERQSPVDMDSFEYDKQRTDINSTIKYANEVAAWDSPMGQGTTSKNQDNLTKNNDISALQEYDPNSRSPTFNPRMHTSQTPQFATNKNGTPDNHKNHSDNEQEQTNKYSHQPKQQQYQYNSPAPNKSEQINYTNIRKSNQFKIQNTHQSQNNHQQNVQQIRVQTVYEKKIVYNTRADSSNGIKNSRQQQKQQMPKIVVNQVSKWDKKDNNQKQQPKNRTSLKSQTQNKNNIPSPKNKNINMNANNQRDQKRQIEQQQEMEEIAEEDDTERLVKKQVEALNITKSISRSNKPNLYSASRIIGMDQELSENQKKGSLIDKIKAETFFESRVILENEISRRQSINNNQQRYDEQPMRKKNLDTELPTKSPRKYKIFGNFDNRNQSKSPYASGVTPPKYNQGPSRIQQQYKYTNNYGDTQRKYGQERMHEYNEEYNVRVNQATQAQRQGYNQSRRQLYQRQTKPNFAICPHTQCILKSLQIIDKLTDQRIGRDQGKQQENQYSTWKQQKQYSKHRSVVSELHQIESQSLDISLQMDKLIAELTLDDLLNQQTTRRIKQMKIEIERLINKIKQNNEQQNFIRFKQSNLSSKSPYKHERVRFDTSRLIQSKWDLCGELQKICKTLHYIQVVQERYKMWKMRLHHLSERVKDILHADRSSQIKKLHDISQHSFELQSSKFYGNEAGLGLIQAFNNYIDKQINQLNHTVEWIKNDILSR